jgi:hypothetical protein
MSNKAESRGLYAHLDTLVTALIVVIAGSVVLFTNFDGQGRLWDRIAGNTPDEAPPVSATIVHVAKESPAVNHMLVEPVENPVPEPAAAPAPAAHAEVAAAPPPAPKKQSWIRHIAGSLNPYSITGPATQHSSAQASATNVTASASASASASPSVSAPSQVAAAPIAPKAAARTSYVNYGNAPRSDIMGSASGPVYNFKGKK